MTIQQSYPILLVDRVLEIEPQKKVRAIKNVSLNEKIFKGHFPENPIYPAIYLVEGLCQCAQLMFGSSVAVTAKLEEFKFTKPVYPGDQIVYEVELQEQLGAFVISKAYAYVDGKKIAQGKILGCEAK